MISTMSAAVHKPLKRRATGARASRPRKSPRVTRPIPVLRPRLPSADDLLPYLRRIDDTRIYTNWGPLVGELERRLAAHFQLPNHAVVSASSGTTALAGAILAAAGRGRPERPLALIPALTFVATATAVEQCGYEPYLLDVDDDTWTLDAARLDAHPLLDRVGLVVPVSTYGRSMCQHEWAAFHRRTGIPVVIDGAASFEAASADPRQCLGRIAVAMSFHATKSFSTAEGGCVVTTDRAVAKRAAQALNFGFSGSRRSRSASTNGKMSEYHAAIGLAELDRWTTKRNALFAVAERYRQHMRAVGLADRLVVAPAVATCYVLLRCADRTETSRMQRRLARARVGFRFWYGDGLLRQPYFSGVPHDTLETTDAIAPCTVGLPVMVDLADEEIEYIVSVIGDTVRR
jgi:dTDP-4-amino-4,6-dideoxygalactose transaminase